MEFAFPVKSCKFCGKPVERKTSTISFCKSCGWNLPPKDVIEIMKCPCGGTAKKASRFYVCIACGKKLL